MLKNAKYEFIYWNFWLICIFNLTCMHINFTNFNKLCVMVDLKIIFLIVSSLVLVVSGVYARTENQVKLKGDLKDETGGLRASGNMDSFVYATFNDVTGILDLEFLDSADDLTIEVWGNDGIQAFDETTNVVNGMHVIANLSGSNAWAFEVYIYNEDTGTFIWGFFELP